MRTKPLLPFLLALAVALPAAGQQTLELTTDELRDRIRGGWAAQTIGVTFGGPTEFDYLGTFIPDYTPLPWHEGTLKWWYDNAPGLYDDVYMDLTFVDVLEREGLDAPADAFARAFAGADYMLWHANQQARYNYQQGLRPPETGHWKNNPEADDIDFQIEADFAGLMSPGLPGAAAEICDRVGHIMNYGDGYYGGLYVATMYALAFTASDVGYVVARALDAIPPESDFHKTIRDVIGWHARYPDDWKQTWFEIQKRWAEDRGCPEGVFDAFDIDAKLNAAYVVLGLLYGDGDFGRTLSIATRAGQDSDCNPATAGGILGTMIGYDRIPAFWKQGLAEVEPVDFKYTTISLDDVYEMSYRHALETVRRHGGTVDGQRVVIPVQAPEAAPLEVSFAGHYPVAEVPLHTRLSDEVTFAFDGVGFTVSGHAEQGGGRAETITVEVYVDGARVETTALPTDYRARKFIPFCRYGLPEGPHMVRLKVRAPGTSYVQLDRAIIYGSAPVVQPY